VTAEGLRLRPSARLQRYLGRELIADPNLAVIEFVKNSYDAGASRVLIKFELTSPESSLVIADDGVGMTLESFEEDWMHPGFSRKSDETPSSLRTRPPRSSAGRRQRGRAPLGEKGLGRLAAGRLGEVLEVFTRPSTKDVWLHATFDWQRFEDMTKAMDEVVIPVDTEAPPEALDITAGTVVLIRDLRLKWDGRVPGRPSPGRSRSRLGRLKQDLELLLRPLDDQDSEFVVELTSDSVVEANDIGTVTPKSATRAATYRYDFHLSTDAAGRTVVHRKLKRSQSISAELGEPRTENLGRTVVTPELARREDRPPELLCGEFSGSFFYDPPPKAKRASQLDAVGHGVLLYRDGAMVEPYGLDANDWVGVEARKAQRQGHALVQPNTFSGEVHIGRTSNPELLDMANRQGLIDNDASSQFLAHVQAEFRFFESVITPELERRWKTKPQRAAEGAEQRVALARVRMRTVAHSLRQPLLGLGNEMAILTELLGTEDISEPVRRQINQVVDAVSNYIDRAESLLSRLASVKIPEFVEVSAREILDGAVAEVADLLRVTDVSVEVTCSTERLLVLPIELMVDAIGELIRNAIESPRRDGPGTVWILARDRGRRDVEIEVSDDGRGLDGVPAGTPLSEIALETKGRPSGGLAAVADALIVVRGKVELVENGTRGATFLVSLPGGLEGLEDGHD
jgi:hypothetical protein